MIPTSCSAWKRTSLLVASCAMARLAFAQSEGSNGVYDVAVADAGEYTARTGRLHPGPQGYSVLYGGGGLTPLTSWSTVRSYGSGTEYVLHAYAVTPSAGFNCESIGDFAAPVVEPVLDGTSATGVRTTWSIRNGADAFDVVQVVNAGGATFSDSAVEVTTCIRNRGAVAASFGIRYLWDWQVGFADGPYLGVRPPYPPDEPLGGDELTWVAPAFDFYDISDTDMPTTRPPLYKVSGSVNGPARTPAATRPDVLEYADWTRAKGLCFDYSTGGRAVGGDGRDSSVLYFWGRDAASALAVSAGGETCVTAYLFAYTSDPPPLCAVTARVAPLAPACVPDVVRLDASTSTAVSCTGGLEYRFTDPLGGVPRDWAPEPTYDAGMGGPWTIEARCASAPDCNDSTTVTVVIEAPPASFALSGRDSDPCQPGLFLEWPFTDLGPWDFVTWGTNGIGTFSVHRSATSCADALAQPPIATGLADANYQDDTAAEGTSYWYAVVAEANDAAVACPGGVERDAPFRTSCLAAPLVDMQRGAAPPGLVGPALRVHASPSREPVLDWTLSAPLAPDETDSVDRSSDPRLLAPHASRITTRAFADSTTGEPLLYYVVLRENRCGQRSSD